MGKSPLATRAHAILPYWLYGLTGFTGLLAEQGFEKYIALLVGATASASAVVIFAYFLGFALGSFAAGRLIQQGHVRQPLHAYGWMELLVGASCVGFTYGFHPVVALLGPLQSLEAGYAATFALRFLFGTLLILPIAALMGASFPLIAYVVDREDSSGGTHWALVYGLNLGGALLACLLGPYLLLPAIGLRGAFWLCGILCALVWIATLQAPSNDFTPAPLPEPASETRERADAEVRVMLLAAFFSGLIFFSLEVLWTHLISTTLGGSVYAFSSMLIMVLLGLFLGALKVRKALAKSKPLVFSRMFQLSALLLICQVRCWDWIQGLFLVPLPMFLRNFWGIELFKLGMAAILILPSAVMLGSIFPSLLGSSALKLAGRSYLLGFLSTANSVGCLVGALAGVFFLIPYLGSELSLKLMCGTLLGLSFLFLLNEKASRRVVIRAVIGSAIVLAYAINWKWDRIMMTSGMNVYFGGASKAAEATGPAPPAPVDSSVKLVYFDEHPQGGFTTVVELRDKYPDRTTVSRMLLSNGKFQGNDGFSAEGMAQVGFAVVPSLFVKHFNRAMLIGLGTGQSAKALDLLGFRRVDIAEYSPGIVDAARKLFQKVNEGVLDQPRTHLYLEDGRNVLLTTSAKYDLVTIEITSIWFAGITNVYSKEFYELAASHMTSDGVLQQWVQLHHIGTAEIASAVATVRQVFPYVSLWYFGDQGMIVATRHPQLADPHGVDHATMVLEHFAQGSGIDGFASRMLHAQLISTSAVDRMIDSWKPVVNTDHNRWIEYSTPRYNAVSEDLGKRNVESLRAFEGPATAAR